MSAVVEEEVSSSSGNRMSGLHAGQRSNKLQSTHPRKGCRTALVFDTAANMSSEDSEHAVSGVRRLMIRNMQKMSSEDSEYAENVPGDSEYAENVLGGFGTCRKWLRRLGKCRKWRRKASTVIYRE